MYSVLRQARRLAAPGRILRPRVRRRVTIGAAGFALLLLSLVPIGAVGAQSFYPPNAVISSYFDPRYCGNGAVAVVTDAAGSLINVCTSTGQRVVPIYPDFAPYGYGYNFGYNYGYNYGYNNGYNTAPTFTYAYTPAYTPSYTGYPAYGFPGFYGYNTTNGNTVFGYGSYTDNRTNCPGGQVTSTPSGYFCTANGAVAFAQ